MNDACGAPGGQRHESFAGADERVPDCGSNTVLCADRSATPRPPVVLGFAAEVLHSELSHLVRLVEVHTGSSTFRIDYHYLINYTGDASPVKVFYR